MEFCNQSFGILITLENAQNNDFNYAVIISLNEISSNFGQRSIECLDNHWIGDGFLSSLHWHLLDYLDYYHWILFLNCLIADKWALLTIYFFFYRPKYGRINVGKQFKSPQNSVDFFPNLFSRKARFSMCLNVNFHFFYVWNSLIFHWNPNCLFQSVKMSDGQTKNQFMEDLKKLLVEECDGNGKLAHTLEILKRKLKVHKSKHSLEFLIVAIILVFHLIGRYVQIEN